jgi:FKBP-type peptidyl-prolyl cis-trans isomerase
MISGVAFSLMDDGRRLSAPIDDATAELFLSIEGYLLHDDVAEPAVKTKAQIAADLKKLADAAKKEADDEAAAEAAVKAEKSKAAAQAKAAAKAEAEAAAQAKAAAEKAQAVPEPVIVPVAAEEGEVF